MDEREFMSIEYSELISRLEEFQERLETLCAAVEVEKGLQEITELEGRMASPDFWNNNDKAQKVIRQLKALRSVVVPLQELSENATDLLELSRMAQEEDDNASIGDLEREYKAIASQIDEVELKTTLNGKHDSCDAFLSIHAGAGGTESCDWASILSRICLLYTSPSPRD